jgi:hypothetical protein
VFVRIPQALSEVVVVAVVAIEPSGSAGID